MTREMTKKELVYDLVIDIQSLQDRTDILLRKIRKPYTKFYDGLSIFTAPTTELSYLDYKFDRLEEAFAETKYKVWVERVRKVGLIGVSHIDIVCSEKDSVEYIKVLEEIKKGFNDLYNQLLDYSKK